MNKFRADYLKGFSFDVSTVVDVGVYKGTHQLYKAFADDKVKFVLIDPLPEAEEVAKKMNGNFDVEFINQALGKSEGFMDFHVPLGDNKSGASVNRRKANVQRNIELDVKKVPVGTMDGIIEKLNVSGPFGLKIDVEGHEVEVLEGAQKTLEHTNFIIIEINIQDIYEKTVFASELISYLSSCGFELFDILNIELTNNAYYDCVFLPKHDPRFKPGYKNQVLKVS